MEMLSREAPVSRLGDWEIKHTELPSAEIWGVLNVFSTVSQIREACSVWRSNTTASVTNDPELQAMYRPSAEIEGRDKRGAVSGAILISLLCCVCWSYTKIREEKSLS